MELEELRKKAKQEFIDRIVMAIENHEKGYFDFQSSFYISDLKPELDVIKYHTGENSYFYILEYKNKYYMIQDKVWTQNVKPLYDMIKDKMWGQNIKILHEIEITEISEEEAIKIIK